MISSNAPINLTLEYPDYLKHIKCLVCKQTLYPSWNFNGSRIDNYCIEFRCSSCQRLPNARSVYPTIFKYNKINKIIDSYQVVNPVTRLLVVADYANNTSFYYIKEIAEIYFTLDYKIPLISQNPFQEIERLTKRMDNLLAFS